MRYHQRYEPRLAPLFGNFKRIHGVLDFISNAYMARTVSSLHA